MVKPVTPGACSWIADNPTGGAVLFERGVILSCPDCASKRNPIKNK
jgi:hypothetical protein